MADALSSSYVPVPVDTIVCMDDTQMIAAFLASNLSGNRSSVNSGKNVNVLIPEFNTNGQMIFRDNLQKMVWKKNVLLLIASATTGKTIKRSLECINYYGGQTIGVAAIFSATPEIEGIKITSVFTSEDAPDYRTYNYRECPECAKKMKIDAIVNSHGYSKI